MNRAAGVKDCPTDHVWFRPFAWLHTDAASASHIIQGDRLIMAPEEIWEMEPGKTPAVEGPTLENTWRSSDKVGGSWFPARR